MALRFHAFLRGIGGGVRDGSLISKRIYMIFNTDYRSDPDLEFLASISSDMLLPLIDAIFYSNKEKRVRFSADDDALNKILKNPRESWRLIAKELQLYGGSTLINSIRNSGVP